MGKIEEEEKIDQTAKKDGNLLLLTLHTRLQRWSNYW